MFDAPSLDAVLPSGALSRCTVHTAERRLEWPGIPAPLEERVASERSRFDRVARWRMAEVRREAAGPWTTSPWLVPEEVTSLLDGHPSLFDVQGLTILDVGGTMPVSWRFLAAGARAVHHVDVSPRSQAVARERCAVHGVLDDRVVFHTVPVESLPFADGSFDRVFSRNSVHHTARPRAYDSLARILRPGGHLVMFEPWLNRLLRPVVMGRRRLLRIDRGTDDPLGRADLRQLAERFAGVDHGLFGAGGTAALWALRRIGPAPRASSAVRALESRLGGVRSVARALAVHGWVVATR